MMDQYECVWVHDNLFKSSSQSMMADSSGPVNDGLYKWSSQWWTSVNVCESMTTYSSLVNQWWSIQVVQSMMVYSSGPVNDGLSSQWRCIERGQVKDGLVNVVKPRMHWSIQVVQLTTV